MFTLTLRMQELHCFHPLLMARFSVSMQHIMVNALRIFSRVGSVFRKKVGKYFIAFLIYGIKTAHIISEGKTPWSLF